MLFQSVAAKEERRENINISPEYLIIFVMLLFSYVSPTFFHQFQYTRAHVDLVKRFPQDPYSIEYSAVKIVFDTAENELFKP